MKSKLIPIIGTLIAGLIGAAGVGCYNATSGYCRTTGQEATSFTLPCGQGSVIYATADWDGVTESETNAPYGSGMDMSELNFCQGPGEYDDYCTSEEVDVDTAIDYAIQTWYTVLGGPTCG
jgi:hypothetical protein